MNRVSLKCLNRKPWLSTLCVFLFACACHSGVVHSIPPAPTLDTVFPLGCKAGGETELQLKGNQLTQIYTLASNIRGFHCEQLGAGRMRVKIPADTPTGLYDLWAVTPHGISNVRTLAVGHRQELAEAEPNSLPSPMTIPLGTTINGAIDTAGDQDWFRFEGQAGQRVVIECWAARVDSRLRPVIDLFDTAGKRLPVIRQDIRTEPLIAFDVPDNGEYLIKLQDLVSAGGPDFGYRLDLHTDPRTVFSLPSAVNPAKQTDVTLYGWNLAAQKSASKPLFFEQSDATVDARAQGTLDCLPRWEPTQIGAFEGVPCYPYMHGHSFPLSNVSVPVILENGRNDKFSSAQLIPVPSEACGRLTQGNHCDWYSISAQRGEVVYFEAFAQRIDSSADLQISVFDANGKAILAKFYDTLMGIDHATIPTDHLDPSGRWVAPHDGTFLIAVSDQAGGITTKENRTYRLSLRREEPDYFLMVAPVQATESLRVQRHGRVALDVVVVRRRNMDAPIRLTANLLASIATGGFWRKSTGISSATLGLGSELQSLTALADLGLECSETWIGANESQTTLIVSARTDAQAKHGFLSIEGAADEIGGRSALPVSIVRTGTPNVWTRVVSALPIAVLEEEAPLRVVADAHQEIVHQLYGKLSLRYSPASVVDVSVKIEAKGHALTSPVKLSLVGLPRGIRADTVALDKNLREGFLSFYLPPTMPLGKFSFAVRAEATMAGPDGKGEQVTVFSNSQTINVEPAAFRVEIDPFAVRRAKRGETIQIGYVGHRTNGFIGKIHTEIASPGIVTNVPGLRARGETFVGQTDRGSLQVIVNPDAALGPQQFLRLLSVGVVEDQAIYFGSDYWELEIVE